MKSHVQVLLIVVAQAVIAISQLTFSAFTGRVLSPEAFGAVIIAVTFAGLFYVVVTAGFASAVLRHGDDRLQPELVWAIRSRAAIYGSLTGLAFVGTGLTFVHFAEASTVTRNSFLLLAPYIFVIALLAPESALLRHEGRSATDGMAQAATAIVSTAACVTILLLTANPLVVVLNPFLSAVLYLSATVGLRNRRYKFQVASKKQRTDVSQFTSRVLRQNLLFLFLGQTPSLVAATALTPAAIGFFSRAATFSSMPMLATSQLLTRWLQPQWRRQTDGIGREFLSKRLKTIWPLFSLIFGLMAALAGPAVELWLGPAWNPAASLAKILCASSAMQVGITVLVNYLETNGFFAAVRDAQIVASGVCGIGLIVIVHAADVQVLIMTILSVQLTLVISLVAFASRRDYIDGGSLVRSATTSLVAFALPVVVMTLLT